MSLTYIDIIKLIISYIYIYGSGASHLIRVRALKEHLQETYKIVHQGSLHISNRNQILVLVRYTRTYREMQCLY